MTNHKTISDVKDGGPWKGIKTKEWIKQLVKNSTPKREYNDNGDFLGWIKRTSNEL